MQSINVSNYKLLNKISQIFNFLSKPQFISYNALNLPFRPARRKSKPLLCWTVKTEDLRQKMQGVADNIIFEDVSPALPREWQA